MAMVWIIALVLVLTVVIALALRGGGDNGDGGPRGGGPRGGLRQPVLIPVRVRARYSRPYRRY